MLFIELPFTLATEEAERIGVDHVAKISSTGIVEGSGKIIVIEGQRFEEFAIIDKSHYTHTYIR